MRRLLLSRLTYIFCPTRVSILQIRYRYTHTHTHTHTSDCVEIVFELPLLLNRHNNESETFLHNSGAVRSVEVLYHLEAAPDWRRLGEYMTLDKKFYNFLFKQKVSVAPLLSNNVPYRTPWGVLYNKYNIIIIPYNITCINTSNTKTTNNYGKFHELILFLKISKNKR
jgi:hypothetical protein